MFARKKPLFSVGQILYRINPEMSEPEEFTIVKVLEYDKHLDSYEYECITSKTNRQFWLFETEYKRREIWDTLDNAWDALSNAKIFEIQSQLKNTHAIIEKNQALLAELAKQNAELHRMMDRDDIDKDTREKLQSYLAFELNEEDAFRLIAKTVSSNMKLRKSRSNA